MKNINKMLILVLVLCITLNMGCIESSTFNIDDSKPTPTPTLNIDYMNKMVECDDVLQPNVKIASTNLEWLEGETNLCTAEVVLVNYGKVNGVVVVKIHDDTNDFLLEEFTVNVPSQQSVTKNVYIMRPDKKAFSVTYSIAYEK